MGNATNNSGFGFRVLKTQFQSPAHEAGIQPFLDFIVNIELTHSELKEANISNIQAFFNTIKENENNEIHVTLFNIYDRQLRKIRMTPHKNWHEADSLLGVLLRYEEYITALERTYKVIQVIKGSEAEKLGFIEDSDYILGLTNYQYKDLGEFIRLLFKAEDVCVFNVKDGQVKFIKMPKEKCVLGCQFGEGILNQLPYKRYELPLIEELAKSPILHEEIVDLTTEEKQAEKTQNQIKPSPKKEIEAPPKKNEIHTEKEHKSGIGLDEHYESKNYQELLKASSSKSTLEYIHHKRSEHLKKNGPTGGRVLPKNPFQSPTFKNQTDFVDNKGEKHEEEHSKLGEKQVENQEKSTNEGKSEETKEQITNLNENPKEKEIENVKEGANEVLRETPQDISKESLKSKPNIKEKSQKEANLKENSQKEDPKENLKDKNNDIKEYTNDSNGNERKEREEEEEEGRFMEEEEEIENARFAKMVMKYSYYCPKIKDEYVINSSDLMSMTVKIQ